LSSDSDSDDFYGTRTRDRQHKRRHSAGGTPLSTLQLDPTSPSFRRRVAQDEGGYIVRPDVYDEATRPVYQIPPVDGGVWDAMGAVVKKQGEGWRGLFKGRWSGQPPNNPLLLFPSASITSGQFTNWLYEMLHLFLQPTLEGTLNDVFDLYDDTIPLVHLDSVGPNVATLVTSHLVVGVLLSPLELIRTRWVVVILSFGLCTDGVRLLMMMSLCPSHSISIRLIVQTTSPLHKKYSGPIHALRTIFAEEGGIQGLYLSHNLIPTILYHSLLPLLSNTAPLIIDRVFHVSASDSPFFYGLAELALNTLELVVSLPLETIRKRLQLQIRSRNPGKRLETVVATRPIPYAGAGDAVIKIMKEEGGKRPKKGAARRSRKEKEEETPGERRKRKGVLGGWGLRGLYNGFGMQFSANVMLFLFHAINGIDGAFGGIRFILGCARVLV
ncbi:hypothetical protein BC938DRAFT_477483, partial [Jimgerdemannia flammicorona]